MTAATSTVDDTYLSTDQVVAATGATRRQVDYWVRVDYLRPVWVGQRGTPAETTGTGRAMRYPPAEVEVARLMVRLTQLGFELARAAELARDPAERTRVASALLYIIDDEPAPTALAPVADFYRQGAQP